jgi:hypothetical protein
MSKAASVELSFICSVVCHGFAPALQFPHACCDLVLWRTYTSRTMCESDRHLQLGNVTFSPVGNKLQVFVSLRWQYNVVSAIRILDDMIRKKWLAMEIDSTKTKSGMNLPCTWFILSLQVIGQAFVCQAVTMQVLFIFPSGDTSFLRVFVLLPIESQIVAMPTSGKGH